MIWLIPIIAGLLIELFFRLIRYSDDASKQGPVAKYRPYNNYVTVNEFVAGGKKRWWKYILFRSLPPLIVFTLLASIYQKYFPNKDIVVPLCLSALIFLLPRDILQVIKKKVIISEKIVHIINIFFVLVVVGIVLFIYKYIPIKYLAPSVNGIVDNAWSSLLIATLVILYLDATNRADTYNEDLEKQNIRENYIITIYNKIQIKFEESILKNCENSKCSPALLFAILIFEDMNRPAIIRKIENFFVRIFACELSVGIAQVKSNKPLTDEESIKIASNRLENSKALIGETFDSFSPEYSEVKKIIKIYNPSSDYADSIIQILSVLKNYVPTIFEK